MFNSGAVHWRSFIHSFISRLFLLTVPLLTGQCNMKIVILHAVPFFFSYCSCRLLWLNLTLTVCVDGFQKWKKMCHVCRFYAETLYDN